MDMNHICAIFVQILFFSQYFPRCSSHARKRRYLGFPNKSNFVITITLLKPTAFMNGVNTLHEIDFNVPLPMNPHAIIRRSTKGPRSRGSWERQVLYGQIEAALDMYGLNGAGCLQRMMCEAQKLNQTEVRKSIVLKILKRVFTLQELQFKKTHHCSRSCPVSIFSPSLLVENK